MLCRACKKQLIPVFGTDAEAEALAEEHNQYTGALEVQFAGGYGMYFDPMTSEQAKALQAVVCAECLNQLCELVPWIGEMFTAHEKLYYEDVDANCIPISLVPQEPPKKG